MNTTNLHPAMQHLVDFAVSNNTVESALSFLSLCMEQSKSDLIFCNYLNTWIYLRNYSDESILNQEKRELAQTVQLKYPKLRITLGSVEVSPV